MRTSGKIDQINASFKEFMLFVQSNNMIAIQEQVSILVARSVILPFLHRSL